MPAPAVLTTSGAAHGLAVPPLVGYRVSDYARRVPHRAGIPYRMSKRRKIAVSVSPDALAAERLRTRTGESRSAVFQRL